MIPVEHSNSLPELGRRIRIEHRATSRALKNSVVQAIAAGKLLIEAKSKIPHSGWLPWLGALLFAFLSLDVCCAQSRADEPAFPFTKSIFRWDYSCPPGLGCSFVCPGQAANIGHVIKLHLYLGAISIDGSQTAPALFYEYSTREFPQASGFSIGSGLSNLSCHVNGMTLDYSGPPK